MIAFNFMNRKGTKNAQYKQLTYTVKTTVQGSLINLFLDFTDAL